MSEASQSSLTKVTFGLYLGGVTEMVMPSGAIIPSPEQFLRCDPDHAISARSSMAAATSLHWGNDVAAVVEETMQPASLTLWVR